MTLSSLWAISTLLNWILDLGIVFKFMFLLSRLINIHYGFSFLFFLTKRLARSFYKKKIFNTFMSWGCKTVWLRNLQHAKGYTIRGGIIKRKYTRHAHVKGFLLIIRTSTLLSFCVPFCYGHSKSWHSDLHWRLVGLPARDSENLGFASRCLVRNIFLWSAYLRISL